MWFASHSSESAAALARHVQRALACAALLLLAAFSLTTRAAPIIHDPTQPEKRLALLIGNADYSISPLTNPENDVIAMEVVLKKAGFRVMKGLNMKRREMARMIREFGDELKAQGGVGLFYYAGHGLQVRGVNYLVPVDAQIKHEDEVALDSVDAQMVLEKMLEAKNRVNVVILDACRNNPFTRSRSAVNGLAKMEAPVGSIVAYSTAPGSVASDGSGSNGLYTEHLINHITEPGLSVEDVFKRVRAAVRRASSGRQIPWESTALEADFVFFPAGAPRPQIALPPPRPGQPGGGAVQLASAGPMPASAMGSPPAPAQPQAPAPLPAPAPVPVAPAPAQPAPPQPMPGAVAATQAGLAQSNVAAAPVSSPNPLPAPHAPPRPAPPAAVAAAPHGLRLPADPRAPIPLAALREAARVPVTSMSVVPQTLATPQPPAAPAAAPEPAAQVASASAAGPRRYELQDHLASARRVLTVSLTNLPDGWRRLSDGTELHPDGRVRRLVLGDTAVKASARAGSLFSTPPAAGANGADTVEVINPDGRSVAGRLSWNARQIGPHVVLTATVDAISFVVNYRAWYAQGEPLAERYEVETQDRMTRKLSQNLSARQVVTN